jgi:hypothetical protein
MASASHLLKSTVVQWNIFHFSWCPKEYTDGQHKEGCLSLEKTHIVDRLSHARRRSEVSMDTSKQKFISHFLFVGEQCGKAEEAITFYLSLFKKSMGCFKSFLKAARFSCLSIDIRSAKSLVGLQINTGFHGN